MPQDTSLYDPNELSSVWNSPQRRSYYTYGQLHHLMAAANEPWDAMTPGQRDMYRHAWLCGELEAQARAYVELSK
jgi:hypothetical protein